MEVIKVQRINKTFRLSRKQRFVEKTKSLVKRAVIDLSFEVYDHEIFGLLGPNGAGKTTTLRMLATLVKPDSGSIEILGHPITEELFIKENIGFLTNELKLEDSFTPNYLFSFFAKLHKMDDMAIEERKKQLFSRFGIDKFSEVKIAELSTGMKQKVSLAISIIHDPKIVIFDEPTNGLDVLTAKVVTDFLAELKNEGKAVIISTHIMNLAEKICDRVGIIIDGEMIVCDKLDEVLKDGKNLEDLFFDLYKQKRGEE